MIKSEFSGGWKEVELSNLFTFQNKTGRKAGEGLEEGEYKFFTSSSKQTKFINEFDFDGKFLIFATGGQAGIHYCDGKFSASNDCFVVKVNDEVLAKYVYYYLLFKIYLLERGFMGAGLRHISKDYLKKIKIIHPESKKTQQKIISILEKAEKLKGRRKKAGEETNKIIQSIFYKIFLSKKEKWKNYQLGELFEIVRGGSPRPIQKYLTKDENGINWIKIGDTKGDSKYIYKTEEKIKPEGLKKTRLVNKGDFILSNSMSFGRPYIVKTKGCVHDGWLIIRDINKRTNNNYLYSILSSNYVYSQFLGFISGSTVKNLKIDVVKKVIIPIPPIGLQNKFSEQVERIESIKQHQQISEKEINILFDALMQKAFNGELIK